jgi:hypothetical protein
MQNPFKKCVFRMRVISFLHIRKNDIRRFQNKGSMHINAKNTEFLTANFHINFYYAVVFLKTPNKFFSAM